MKYRKLPIEVEAFELATGFGPPKPRWFQDAIQRGEAWGSGRGWFLKTLEGEMRTSLGDMIVQGVKGEIYAVKPDIFRATYEPVPSPSNERVTERETV